MTTFTYVRDIPDAPNNPSNDQPNIKTNTNSTDDLIAVDHNSFNVSNGGYHTVIHEDPQGRIWNPVTRTFSPVVASIPGINEVFTAVYTPDFTGATADTQLFAQTGLGGVSQLTGALSTSDGWQWIGSVLIQWGSFTVPSSNFLQAITFKDRVVGAIPFPNNCFVVLLTLDLVGAITQSGSADNLAIAGNPTATGFVCTGKLNSTATTRKVFWVAIGN